MQDYAVLLRGINVGGKNKIAMPELARCLESHGCRQVATYLNSGNVLLQSGDAAEALGPKLEAMLSQNFRLDTSLIKVLVLTKDELQAVADAKPAGFGDEPEKYHSDVIFLMGMSAADALPVFQPREGVDTIWPGPGVIYSQRLSALRTKSRLSRIMGTPAYRSMTIRTWNTTTRLLELLGRPRA
ncbi:MAG TPA: DUF1697 domain-containing protein [Candidatus Saccharimonadales bacterium]|nr:DUF1697 domain-containing protein [Candidatus Saccharimonadales bacterium]